MTSFVYDGTSLPNGKIDRAPSPGPADQYVTAAEWNTAMQAMLDIRTAILSGTYTGTSAIYWKDTGGVTQARSWWDTPGSKLVLAGDATGTTAWMSASASGAITLSKSAVVNEPALILPTPVSSSTFGTAGGITWGAGGLDFIGASTQALSVGAFNKQLSLYSLYVPPALYGVNIGSLSTDVGPKIGLALADGSVHASAKLFSIRSGINATEVEHLYFTKGGGLVVDSKSVTNQPGIQIINAGAGTSGFALAMATGQSAAWGNAGGYASIGLTTVNNGQHFISNGSAYDGATRVFLFRAAPGVNTKSIMRVEGPASQTASLIEAAVGVDVAPVFSVESSGYIRQGTGVLGPSTYFGATQGWVVTNDSLAIIQNGTLFPGLSYGVRIGSASQLIRIDAGAGTGASDIAILAGTNIADASVHASAKLLSLRTGIGGTEVEKLAIRKDGALLPSGSLLTVVGAGTFSSSLTASLFGALSGQTATLFGGLGAGSTDVVTKAGTSVALASTHASAELFRIATGIGGTESGRLAVYKGTQAEGFELGAPGVTGRLSLNNSSGWTLGWGSSAAIVDTNNVTINGSVAAILRGNSGASSIDVASKVGTTVADASVHASAKLWSARTGLGGTEVESLAALKGGILAGGNAALTLNDSVGARLQYAGGSSVSVGTNAFNVGGSGLWVMSFTASTARIYTGSTIPLELFAAGLGGTAGDVCTKVGTSIADASVNATAKLFSVRTGLNGGTEVEKAWFTKTGQLNIVQPGINTPAIQLTGGAGGYGYGGSIQFASFNVLQYDSTVMYMQSYGSGVAAEIRSFDSRVMLSSKLQGTFAADEVAVAAGTRLSDGSVDATTRLFTVRSGLTATEVEYLRVGKAITRFNSTGDTTAALTTYSSYQFDVNAIGLSANDTTFMMNVTVAGATRFGLRAAGGLYVNKQNVGGDFTDWRRAALELESAPASSVGSGGIAFTATAGGPDPKLTSNAIVSYASGTMTFTSRSTGGIYGFYKGLDPTTAPYGAQIYATNVGNTTAGMAGSPVLELTNTASSWAVLQFTDMASISGAISSNQSTGELRAESGGDTTVYTNGALTATFTQNGGSSIVQQAWQTPTFSSADWSNYGGSTNSVKYYKDTQGFVHIRGHAQRTAGATTLIFTLPAGYRPAGDSAYAVPATNAFGQVTVYTDGRVQLDFGTATYVALDGINFDTR